MQKLLQICAEKQNANAGIQNKMELCPKFNEFESLCPSEMMLISQIIVFMFIVAKVKGAQQGLKGQSVCFSSRRFEESSDHFTKIV